MSRALSLLFLLLTVSACLQHPYYCYDLEVPEDWRVDAPSKGELVNACWWAQFHDPVLDDLIQEALESNRNLQVAIARILEFYAQVGVIRSKLWPELNTNVTLTRERASMIVNAIEPGVNPTFSVYSLFLNLSYEMDLWGKIQNASDAAVAELLAQDAACRGVLITLLSDVASSYIQLRKFDKQLEIGRQTLASREHSLELAQLRFEGGLTSELEVKQAQSEVETAVTETIRVEILIEQEENLLSTLVGHAPRAIKRGRRLDDIAMPPCVPADLPCDIITQRPDILEAEQQLIAAHLRVDQARADFFPAITLTSMVSTQSDSWKGLFSGPGSAWNIAGSLLQPIFNAGRIASQVNRQSAIEREALFHYEDVVLNAFREVSDAMYSHIKFKELLLAQAKLVEVLQDYLRLATAQYDNGETDYLNVLDAQRRLFAAELDLAQAQADSFLSLIDLYRALGGGW